MAELKTKKTDIDAKTFLESLADEQQRADALQVMKLMQKATGAKPAMWGPSIVGFGNYRYVYPNGREMDWFLVGFSPRKGNLTLYLGDMKGKAAQLKALGKHKTGKGCLYIKRLEDVDQAVLAGLVNDSVAARKASEKSR